MGAMKMWLNLKIKHIQKLVKDLGNGNQTCMDLELKLQEMLKFWMHGFGMKPSRNAKALTEKQFSTAKNIATTTNLETTLTQ